MSLDREREEWEKEALTESFPASMISKKEDIAGVECVWVSEESIPDSRVVIYLHGGGLVAGSAVTHQNIAARICRSSNCKVLLVNYRLLPENKYPAPLEDVLSVYKAIIGDYGYSSDQIILGGDSSGGGLALAALVCLRESNVSIPGQAFMLSGAFDMTLTSDSQRCNESTELHMSKTALKSWQTQYLEYELESPLLSPLYANLSSLPPILLIAGGKEPWVSDSEAVAEKIKRTGGQVKLKTWPTMGHVFIMDSGHTESTEALQEIAGFINGDIS